MPGDLDRYAQYLATKAAKRLNEHAPDCREANDPAVARTDAATAHSGGGNPPAGGSDDDDEKSCP